MLSKPWITPLLLIGGCLLPFFPAEATLHPFGPDFSEAGFGRAEIFPAKSNSGSDGLKGPLARASDWSSGEFHNLEQSGDEKMEEKEKQDNQARLDERVFGCSVDSSEISKPRRIDFSFGAPGVVFTSWNVAPVAGECLAPDFVEMKRAFEPEELRVPEFLVMPETEAGSISLLLPFLSMTGVVGLLVRRTR